MLIESFEDCYVLGVEQMDDTHREFVELLNRLEAADKQTFVEQFPVLVTHTEAHFACENAMMCTTGFPAIREHMEEHERVLGEMNRLADKAASGSLALARAYVRDQLPQWFNLHAVTMDSALAAHLKLHEQGRIPVPACLH